MKFKKFYNLTDRCWIVFFPTIVLTINDPIYREKNFSIQFHFLGFHLKWFFIKEGKEAE
jgi:hypothetical protein